MKTKNASVNLLEVEFTPTLYPEIPITCQTEQSGSGNKTKRISVLFQERHALPWEVRFEGKAGEELTAYVKNCARQYCSGTELDDVVQETILRIHARMDEWIVKAGFDALGLKIWGEVRNCLRALRKARERLVSEANDDATVFGVMAAAGESDLVNQFEAYLAQEFGEQDQRVLIVRKIYQGYSIQEFLEALDIDRKVFYRTLRQDIARAWNKANPDQRRELPRKCA